MAVVGNNTLPNSGWAFYGLNVQNQIWSNFTMPTPGGWITDIHCYFSPDLGLSTCFVVLWVAGTVVATFNTGSIPVGAHMPGGQAWQGGTLTTPVYIVGGSSISIGGWAPQVDGIVFSSESSGSSFSNTAASGPGSQSGSGSTGIGALGAYADYTPNLISVRRSGAWVECPLWVRRSGVWVPATPISVRRSGAWVQVQ